MSGRDGFFLTSEEVDAFVRDVLFAPARTFPVVGISTKHGSAQPWVDPVELQQYLGAGVLVRAFVTGTATWRLSSCLPERLDVFGGAIRIWWPGLNERSDACDHPLFIVEGPARAGRARELIRRALTERLEGLGHHGDAARDGEERVSVDDEVPRGAEQTERAKTVERATVTAIKGHRIFLDIGGESGVLAYADTKLRELAALLSPGDSIRVFRTPSRRADLVECSAQGLDPEARIPAARSAGVVDPWARIADEYAPGHVVRARVDRVEDHYILVELLPDARAIVHISELDYSYTSHPDELFEVGDVVDILILTLDPRARRCEGSIKRAYGNEVRPAISLAPGGRPFLGEEELESRPPAAGGRELHRAQQRVEELTEERQRLENDRRQLVARARELDDQNIALRKELRSVSDRLEAALREAERVDAFASETNFLTAVRVAYAQLFGEHDRFEYPLRRMKVGPEFMARAGELQGIDREKIVEVCALVVSGRCHELPGRQVHELHTGKGGTATRLRGSDDARAWRCALQINTPSARRLHWWSVPGPDGGTIEFASVAVHDDFTIPE
ncbi:MAG: S1 RNA-binding domain-containing protein [Nannocystaceae bacterium]